MIEYEIVVFNQNGQKRTHKIFYIDDSSITYIIKHRPKKYKPSR